VLLKKIHALVGARVKVKIVGLTGRRLAMLLGEELLRNTLMKTGTYHLPMVTRLRTRKGGKGVSQDVKMVGSRACTADSRNPSRALARRSSS
jgi:hypothetical protein